MVKRSQTICRFYYTCNAVIVSPMLIMAKQEAYNVHVMHWWQYNGQGFAEKKKKF